MKMTRDQLKGIIKECLLEILADGMGDAVNEIRSTPRRQASINGNQATGQMRGIMEQRRAPSVLDLPASRPQMREAIKEMTKDPLMSSIFADTANTTLVEQNSAGHAKEGGGVPVHGDRAQQIAAAVTPAELFPEAAGKWAEAAFAPPLRGGRPSLPTVQVAQQSYVSSRTRAPMIDFDPYAPNPEIEPA